ncbi:MAG: methylenetetrahydrofolate reductase [Bacteroidales bacterium]|jgi:methylenetetrahydrofolate reductase (NADPH)|nr:methylenetetrahydrofolate reductase [Bacteroidales bacterium]
MKVSTILETAKIEKRTIFSFEIVPPLRGGDVQNIYRAVEPLMEFNPPHINITYHRDEVEYRTTDAGVIKKIVTTKRPGSVALAAALMNRFKVEVVPHVVCAGATQYELENDLIDLNFMGIENVLALRGDPQPGEHGIFTPEAGGHRYACGLVKQIVAMNSGKYLDETLREATPTNFCTGVAGYPEKHYEAADAESDIEHLRAKVAAGADYIVTQMFFDNARFFDFVKHCRAAGITVPIIPGLKPISTVRHLETLPKTFNINIPEELVRAVEQAAKTDLRGGDSCSGGRLVNGGVSEPVSCNAAVRKAGVEWAIAQSRELIAHGVPAVHYYTMGKSDNIVEIARAVF